MSLFDYIPKANPKKQNGLPCWVCGSSDALSIDVEEGDTGLVHCFSCQGGWTGAQYMAEVDNIPLHEAIELLGGPPTDGNAPGIDVKRTNRKIEKRIRKRERGPFFGDFPDEDGLSLLEVIHLLAQLTPREEQLWKNMMSLPDGTPPHLQEMMEASDEEIKAYHKKRQYADCLLRVFWDNFHQSDDANPQT